MTIFDNPTCSRVMRALSLIILNLLRWKILGKELVLPKKSVIIAYPHSKASDLFYTIMIAFVLGINIKIIAKRELFTCFTGPMLRFFGCIPVERKGRRGVTKQLTQMIMCAPKEFHLVIAPTGTRSNQTDWTKGFLVIASAARVPLLLATISRDKKEGGVFAMYIPEYSYNEEIIKKGITQVQGIYAKHSQEK